MMTALDRGVPPLWPQPKEGETVTASYEEVPADACPECGGETGVQKWTAADCVHGDTSIRYCIECDWRGEPE